MKTALRPSKTKGEIESSLCETVSKFYLEYVGRGPTNIRAHLLGSIALVHVEGSITKYERRANPLLLKQFRRQVFESARKLLQEVIGVAIGCKVVWKFYDMCSESEEEMLFFSLGRKLP